MSQQINAQKMTAQEQAEALALLKKALEWGKLKYKYNNPLDENCYISSAGSYEGIYFPNSSITDAIEHSNYYVIIKNDNKLGFLLSSRLLNDFFISFDDILFSYDEQNAIKSINIKIEYYKNIIEVLKDVHFITKKNGEPFINILKNIDSTPLDDGSIIKAYIESNISTLNIYKYHTTPNYYTSTPVTFWNKEFDNVETLKNNISERLETAKKELIQYQKEKNKVHQIFIKVNDFKKYTSEFSYTMKEAIKKAL